MISLLALLIISTKRLYASYISPLKNSLLFKSSLFSNLSNNSSILLLCSINVSQVVITLLNKVLFSLISSLNLTNVSIILIVASAATFVFNIVASIYIPCSVNTV
jgi:hypothetical protein